MNLLKRIKNVWRLSAYHPVTNNGGDVVIKKDIPTMQKRSAIIIQEERDILNEEIQDDTSN
jgi:hypothetical protein